jgi:hypothetical protein
MTSNDCGQRCREVNTNVAQHGTPTMTIQRPVIRNSPQTSPHHHNFTKIPSASWSSKGTVNYLFSFQHSVSTACLPIPATCLASLQTPIFHYINNSDDLLTLCILNCPIVSFFSGPNVYLNIFFTPIEGP